MTYSVNFATSKKSIEVEDGGNILDAAIKAGLMLPHSCRGGSCGSCAARLISGDISYPEGQPRSLSEEAQKEGQILLCQANVNSDLTVKERPLARESAIPLQLLPARVAELNKLNHDVMQLKLQPPGARKLEFYAGQYLDIMLSDGRRRSFSIANPPHDNEHIELHIRRVAGGYFTNHVFEGLQEKAMLRLQGPLGSFYLREQSERPIIMVAGGTGFAPMAGMIKHAIHSGIKRPIHFFWGIKTPEDLYSEEPQEWANAYENISFTPVYSEKAPNETAQTGWVHEAVVNTFPDLSAHEIYMAGPPPMIDASQLAFVNAKLDSDHLYYDSFDFSHG